LEIKEEKEKEKEKEKKEKEKEKDEKEKEKKKEKDKKEKEREPEKVKRKAKERGQGKGKGKGKGKGENGLGTSFKPRSLRLPLGQDPGAAHGPVLGSHAGSLASEREPLTGFCWHHRGFWSNKTRNCAKRALMA